MRGLRVSRRFSQPLFGVSNRSTAWRTAIAPETKSVRMSRCPIFEVFPSRALPSVECCFGTSPSQAAKSHPRRKVARSRANVSIPSAVTGTTPGMVCVRRTKSAFLAAHRIFASSSATRVFSPSICPRYIRPRSRTSACSAVSSPAIASASRLRWAGPRAATNPCSARWPRKALIIWGRWPTNICRVRNSMARAC